MPATSPSKSPFTLSCKLFLCLALLGIGAVGTSRAQDRDLWSLGAAARGFIDFEPGNDYVLGFDAGYSPARLFGYGLRNRLELRAAYLTSRPEAAYRNVLKQDWFLFSPVWHFRPHRFFDPTAQVDLGWYRYDVENEAIFGDLQNAAVITALQFGFQLNFTRRYAFRYAFGYQGASTASSAVYPLPFTVGFSAAFP